MKEVVIYTDGACRGNPGPGGWGAVLIHGGREREIKGGEPRTTNNRMELTAAIRALQALREPCLVTLYTDSTYVKQGLNEWLPGWKLNGWRTSDKKPVKNKDLWEELDVCVKPHKIDWRWVKGHAGDPGNERADQLAGSGLEQALVEA